jgi:hypothetical protein
LFFQGAGVEFAITADLWVTLKNAPETLKEHAMERWKMLFGTFIVIAGSFLLKPMGGCVAVADQKAGKSETSILGNGPAISGGSYRCADMVRVVNQLRRLGKRDAIRLLKQYIQRSRLEDDDPVKIILICRCLFENPKGWNPPRLGEPVPEVAEAAVKKFPAFPIGFSRRVPFLVIGGYRLGGRPENPMVTLRQCETLSLIESDLPTIGYRTAAQSLLTDAGFRGLYPDAGTRKEMASIIMRQARERQGHPPLSWTSESLQPTKDKDGGRTKGVGSHCYTEW